MRHDHHRWRIKGGRPPWYPAGGIGDRGPTLGGGAVTIWRIATGTVGRTWTSRVAAYRVLVRTLTDHDDRWDLPCRGVLVTQVQVDFAFGSLTSSGLLSAPIAVPVGAPA